MQYISYIFLAVFIITIIILVVRTRIINNKIKMNGTETEAIVTRITEQESSDVDGGSSISYSYYVTYRTQTGQTVEAKLTSGNSLDKQFGKTPGIRIFMKESRSVSNICRINRITLSVCSKKPLLFTEEK